MGDRTNPRQGRRRNPGARRGTEGAELVGEGEAALGRGHRLCNATSRLRARLLAARARPRPHGEPRRPVRGDPGTALELRGDAGGVRLEPEPVPRFSAAIPARPTSSGTRRAGAAISSTRSSRRRFRATSSSSPASTNRPYSGSSSSSAAATPAKSSRSRRCWGSSRTRGTRPRSPTTSSCSAAPAC